ncbi:MAG TPA: hypothetical protein PKA58_36705, partial [Polyangium sp.]|nr:hypothetical protein [Polyangium sp.]
FVATVIAGCIIDFPENGTQTIPPPTDYPSATSSSSSSSGSTTSSSSGQGGNGQGGSGGGTAAEIPRTCMGILKLDPTAMSGTHTVDPDGAGPNQPFDVVCKIANGQAWTLVGLEKPGSSENLRFLGVETGSAANLVAKNNALIGVRFRGLYSAVRIEWDTASYVEFVANSEIFDDTVALDLSISNVTSSDANFDSWVFSGAKLCRAASKMSMQLPGDSSWALKPINDNNNDCGCNNPGWYAQGIFYSGTGFECSPPCGCHTGGLVGVKDYGADKSGVVSWETRIFVL